MRNFKIIFSKTLYIMDLDNNIQRNHTSHNKNENEIDQAVQSLLKKDSTNFNGMKSVDQDTLSETIKNAYIEKHHKIMKKATKFASLIKTKYSNTNTPFHMILNKALKFKKKYELSDGEFSEFKRIYEKELIGMKSPDVIVPTTNHQI